MRSKQVRKNPFLEVQNVLDGVFDVFEHVNGQSERELKEEEVYDLLINLVMVISGMTSSEAKEVCH